jgi:hypothetical protein
LIIFNEIFIIYKLRNFSKHNFGTRWEWYVCNETCRNDYNINIVKIKNIYCALLVEIKTVKIYWLFNSFAKPNEGCVFSFRFYCKQNAERHVGLSVHALISFIFIGRLAFPIDYPMGRCYTGPFTSNIQKTTCNVWDRLLQ